MRTKSEFYKATQACSQKESFGTQIVFYALIFFFGPLAQLVRAGRS